MKKILYLVFCMFFSIGVARAGDFGPLVEEAKAAYEKGAKAEAAMKLKESLLSIWDEVPLSVTEARLVSDHKAYSTRANNVYAPGETIYITSRLLGYKLKKVGDLYKINVVTDFYVVSEDGSVLGGQKRFADFGLDSPFPVTDFRMDLTYTISGAPPGTYEIQTIIHDKNSGKETEFTKKIQIK